MNKNSNHLYFIGLALIILAVTLSVAPALAPTRATSSQRPHERANLQTLSAHSTNTCGCGFVRGFVRAQSRPQSRPQCR